MPNEPDQPTSLRSVADFQRSALTPSGVLSLSVAERIQLVEDIWDTIVEVPDELGLTDLQKAEIDRRLDAYHRSPEEGSPWDMVRERILGRQ
jgi:putative addiction module component (TIGR02574 family)